jgi:hypothetical protein
MDGKLIADAWAANFKSLRESDRKNEVPAAAERAPEPSRALQPLAVVTQAVRDARQGDAKGAVNHAADNSGWPFPRRSVMPDLIAEYVVETEGLEAMTLHLAYRDLLSGTSARYFKNLEARYTGRIAGLYNSTGAISERSQFEDSLVAGGSWRSRDPATGVRGVNASQWLSIPAQLRDNEMVIFAYLNKGMPPGFVAALPPNRQTPELWLQLLEVAPNWKAASELGAACPLDNSDFHHEAVQRHPGYFDCLMPDEGDDFDDLIEVYDDDLRTAAETRPLRDFPDSARTAEICAIRLLKDLAALRRGEGELHDVPEHLKQLAAGSDHSIYRLLSYRDGISLNDLPEAAQQCPWVIRAFLSVHREELQFVNAALLETREPGLYKELASDAVGWEVHLVKYVRGNEQWVADLWADAIARNCDVAASIDQSDLSEAQKTPLRVRAFRFSALRAIYQDGKLSQPDRENRLRTVIFASKGEVWPGVQKCDRSALVLAEYALSAKGRSQGGQLSKNEIPDLRAFWLARDRLCIDRGICTSITELPAERRTPELAARILIRIAEQIAPKDPSRAIRLIKSEFKALRVEPMGLDSVLGLFPKDHQTYFQTVNACPDAPAVEDDKAPSTRKRGRDESPGAAGPEPGKTSRVGEPSPDAP